MRLNGRPLDGAGVQVVAEGGIAAAFDSTSHLGLFRVEGLAPGRYQLTVGDPASRISERRSLDLGEDQTVEIDLRAGALAGVIVDGATGRPLEEAMVEVREVTAAGAGGGQPEPQRSSDAQGHFGFDPLAPGAYAVTVKKPGYAEQSVTATVGAQATATLAVALVPATDAAPVKP